MWYFLVPLRSNRAQMNKDNIIKQQSVEITPQQGELYWEACSIGYVRQDV